MERELELIASVAQAVNSDSRVRRMVGSRLSMLRTVNLWRHGTCFAMHFESIETAQQLALSRRANVRVELDNRGTCLRSVRLPARGLNAGLLQYLVNALQNTRIAGRRGHRECEKTGVQADPVFDEA